MRRKKVVSFYKCLKSMIQGSGFIKTELLELFGLVKHIILSIGH